jgi:hypothetical protein
MNFAKALAASACLTSAAQASVVSFDQPTFPNTSTSASQTAGDWQLSFSVDAEAGDDFLRTRAVTGGSGGTFVFYAMSDCVFDPAGFGRIARIDAFVDARWARDSIGSFAFAAQVGDDYYYRYGFAATGEPDPQGWVEASFGIDASERWMRRFELETYNFYDALDLTAVTRPIRFGFAHFARTNSGGAPTEYVWDFNNIHIDVTYVVPEPATLGLLIGGAILAIRRR